MLLRKILFPFSLVYALVVRVRNSLYDSGFYRAKKFRVKTICIGNISVGGTGKTPMVEYLISDLKNQYKVSVLSRGYKRTSKGFFMADSESTVTQLGDEPYQIYLKFPEITVAVDADRCNGVTILEKKINPDVILLDDAFQHRKITADFNLLLTAYGKLYCDDWYLPSGNLRDSRSSVVRADLIIVTKCPVDLGEYEKVKLRQRLNPSEGQEVLFATLEYGLECKGRTESRALSFFKGKQLTLVTGIADPEPLKRYLTSQRLVFNHLNYPDHHFFKAKELKRLNQLGIILTTEKDYVRLKEQVKNLYYVPIRHRFLGNDGTILRRALKDFMKRDL